MNIGVDLDVGCAESGRWPLGEERKKRKSVTFKNPTHHLSQYQCKPNPPTVFGRYRWQLTIETRASCSPRSRSEVNTPSQSLSVSS